MTLTGEFHGVDVHGGDHADDDGETENHTDFNDGETAGRIFNFEF